MINRLHSPKRSLRAFGLALVAVLAFAGLAAGSASALSVNPSSGSGNVKGAGFNWQASGGPAYTCESSSGNYSVSGGTGGLFEEVKLRGCAANIGGFKVNCTTSGQLAGTIALSNLSSSLVYLDAAKTKFGYKLTPVGGTVAQFSCGGSSYKWTGSVLGQITEPPFNTWTKSAKLRFTATSGSQDYQQVEGAGTAYHLYQSQNGGSNVNLAIVTDLNLESSTAFSFQP